MRLSFALVAACTALACDAAPREQPAEPRPRTSSAAATGVAAPRLLLLATEPGQSESALIEASAGSGPTTIARFSHVPDGEVRGALLPDATRAVVVADMERRRDPSFGAWLLGVKPGGDTHVLAKGCVHATRPWVLPTGRVLVQRGEPGPDLDPSVAQAGALRTDALRIDEVDPESAAVRTVHAFPGYITHVAGVLDGEVFVYRVAHQGADLIAVSLESGSVRVLAQPFVAQARDFSVDPSTRSLVYANLASSGWAVERLFVDSGKRETIAHAEGMWVTPSVWPSGGVLVNDGRGAVTLGGSGPNRPLGAGFDEVAATRDGHVALVHRVPSGFSQVFVTTADGAGVTLVPAPTGHRLSVVGFAP